MQEIYKFSCDDRNDLHRSLANYYAISIEDFEKKIEAALKEVDLDNGLENIAYLMNPEFKENENAKLQISFYHRCTTNGEKSWFKTGLLNTRDGLNKYVSQIKGLLPPDISELLIEKLKNSKTAGIITTKAQDEVNRENEGICAFYRLQDACSSEASGYDIPEIFDNLFSKPVYHKIKEEVLEVLQPTVVKFFVEKKFQDIDDILKKYWEFLNLEEDSITTYGADVGRGVTIPSTNIEKIIAI